MAERNLKLRFAELNLNENERRKENENSEKVKQKESREEKAEAFMRMKAALAKKRKEASIKNSNIRKQVMEECDEVMKKGGSLDLTGLAKRFDLDLDELKKMVDEKTSRTAMNTHPEKGSSQ